MSDNIGRDFLEKIDNFIEKNLRTLTCAKIQEIYNGFFNDLKELKGNSHGFTGLSEYLIFRSLFHLLGGRFEPSKHKWIREFKSTINHHIRIGQSFPIHIHGKKVYPDITVYHADRLHAVAQIKIYLTGGSKELFNEITKLKSLRDQFSDMQALLIIFCGLSIIK